MNGYLLLADLVALIHAAFIAFVVVGFALIVVGAAMQWRWTRGFWFRLLHLVAIAFVCAESIAGYVCPLTMLEDDFRRLGGSAGYPHDFVGYWIDRLIFFDFPPAVFMAAYLLFGAAVVAVFIWSPPRMPKWNR
jgi:Protein of Unknown function (DUF2784)